MIFPYKHNRMIINDVKVLILLFPIWWILGVEQFIWFFYLLIIFIKMLIFKKGEFRLSNIHLIFFVFLCSVLLSIVNIDLPVRYITFFKNFCSFGSAWLCLVIVHNSLYDWNELLKLLRTLIGVILFSAVVGVVNFFFSSTRIEITSMISFFLPDSLLSTSFGSILAVRNFGAMDNFILIGQYFRVNSLFLFATMFASVLALSFPFLIFLKKISKGFWSNFFCNFAILITILALVFTTGRVAIFALIIGFLYFRFFIRPDKIIKIIYLGAFACVSLAIIVFFMQDSLFIDFVNLILNSRGEGSKMTRIQIYINSLESLKEHFIIGWGTQRDVSGMHYPLGSHSFYLGILYKYGILGFSSFLCFLVLVWKKIKVIKMKNLNDEILILLNYGRVMMFVLLINGITDEFDLDSTVMFFLALFIAILLKASDLYKKNIYDT
jgi:O-antigen ligase